METNSKSLLEKEAIEVIQKVNKATTHTWLFTKMSNGLWLLLEILCYLLLVGLVLFAIFLPSGEIHESLALSESVTVDTNVKVKEIIEIFVILKGIIVVLGLLMIFPASLFRKLRRKNNLLEDLNDVSGKFLEKHSL
jgi:hypothetical protein